MPKKFDLNTPEGRKLALQEIVGKWQDGDATASDAKGALQVLMKLEGDISDNAKDELRADPYSVMKVFLRAEGMTAVESLRKNMTDNDIAEGLAKVLGAVKVGIKWGDGGVGRYIKTFKEERAEAKKEEETAIEVERLDSPADVEDAETSTRHAGNESREEEGDSA